MLYQLQATKAVIIIAHPDGLSVAEAAARQHGLPSDRVLVFNTVATADTGKTSVEDMVQLGRNSAPAFQERKLKPGEGKTKLAFLSFSSGTTGRPKVGFFQVLKWTEADVGLLWKAVAIPHYAPIANVIQIAIHNRVNEDYCPWEDRRYRLGDIAIGGVFLVLTFVLYYPGLTRGC